VGGTNPQEGSRIANAANLVAPDPLQSASAGREKGEGAASWFPVEIQGRKFLPTMQSRWKTNEAGMERLRRSQRLIPLSNTIRYARSFNDFSVTILAERQTRHT
jgi:adenine-specific DNA-methyltransferase